LTVLRKKSAKKIQATSSNTQKKTIATTTLPPNQYHRQARQTGTELHLKEMIFKPNKPHSFLWQAQCGQCHAWFKQLTAPNFDLRMTGRLANGLTTDSTYQTRRMPKD